MLDEMLKKRKIVLEKAKLTNPNSWSGSVRNCKPVGVVMLNPDRDENTALEKPKKVTTILTNTDSHTFLFYRPDTPHRSKTEILHKEINSNS